MPTHPGLLQNVFDNPDDDPARLVYADWLEENGDPQRAEFIRVQVDRATLPWWREDHDWLGVREMALLEENYDRWVMVLPPWARDAAEFERGFVHSVCGTGADWVADCAALRQHHPVRFLHLRKRRGRLLQALVRSEAGGYLTGLGFDGLTLGGRQLAEFHLLDFEGVHTLHFSSCELAPDAIHGLVDQGNLQYIRNLEFFLCNLGDHRASEFLNRYELDGFERLSLVNNGLTGDEFLTAITTSPACRRLRSLDLSANFIGDLGVRRLAEEGPFECLEHLDLRNTVARGSGLAALANAPWTRTLHSLDLQTHKFQRPGLEALAQSPYLRSLKALDLRDTRLNAARLQPFVDAPVLESLEFLCLSANRLDDKALAAFVRSKKLANLRTLDVNGNKLAPGSWIKALADSPHLSNLRRLCLADTKLNGRDLMPLTRSPYLHNLAVLDLRQLELDAEFVAALCAAPHLQQLRLLQVAPSNHFPSLRRHFGERVQ